MLAPTLMQSGSDVRTDVMLMRPIRVPGVSRELLVPHARGIVERRLSPQALTGPQEAAVCVRVLAERGYSCADIARRCQVVVQAVIYGVTRSPTDATAMGRAGHRHVQRAGVTAAREQAERHAARGACACRLCAWFSDQRGQGGGFESYNAARWLSGAKHPELNRHLAPAFAGAACRTGA